MLSTPKRAEILTYLEERRDAFDAGDAAGKHAVVSALIADIGGPNYRSSNDSSEPTRVQKILNALGKYIRP